MNSLCCFLISMAAVSFLVAIPIPSLASTVTVNTDAAVAVLRAIHNRKLSHAESLRIARLPGNQGVIRKTVEFGAAATTENFADALYAVAHGSPSKDPVAKFYQFDLLQLRIGAASKLLRQIANRPESFAGPLEQRINQFSPQGSNLTLKGYVVAAGDGGGYAFGGNDFYLNLVMSNELSVAKLTTEHELYHAVQGAFASDRGSVNDLPPLAGLSDVQQRCLKTRHLFDNIYEEGSAKYVEDSLPIQDFHSAVGLKQQKDFAEGVRHVHTSASLLEMSVISLSNPQSMDYDDVYDVGFYGHGTLYSIAYVMTKAIAEEDGDSGIARLLTTPSDRFILRYTRLKAYGKDAEHPLLGAHTIAAAIALEGSCPPAR